MAPSSVLKKIKDLRSVTDVICLNVPANFHAVGQFYEEFYQVNDDEVIQLLKEVNMNSINS